MKSIQCVVTLFVILGGLNWANAVEISESKLNINPQQIFVEDVVTARKIAISFHHAVLEIDYDRGYIIADLSEREIQDLRSKGFKLEAANAWQSRFLQFQSELEKKRAQALKSNSQLPGIVGYECYPTVEETLSQAAQLAQENPTLASWIDIGDSWNKTNAQGGYDLMVLKMTNQAISGDKPVLFIQSSMHAREYTPAALTLDFAKHLLNEYTTDADIQWILNYHEVHILFQMNPDGRKIAEGQILQRKNTNANHCAAGNIGVDLNRNFAFTWDTAPGGSSGNDCDATYRGPVAESEPETQAVSNYIRSLFADRRGADDRDAAPSDTTGMHLDIHSYSELVLWPYGHTTSVSPNNEAFVELGNKLAWFNKYAPMQSVGLYATDGTSDDASYGELGVAALTFELGTDFFQACSVYEQKVKPDNIPALVYAAKAVAAPYLLPFGPEISQISLNGSENGVSITQGSVIELTATASAVQTSLSDLGRQVSQIEYSIDDPIWLDTTTPVILTDSDGAVTSGVETLRGQIDSSSLSEGQHTLYVRALNGNSQAGVASAVFINIGQNTSPTPEFSVDCNNLACNFDATASVDPDGTITEFLWNFNDGNTDQGISASNIFSSAGDKEVTLTITDNSGNQSIKSQNFAVTAAPVTEPEPEPTPDETNSSSGGGSLLWLFGLGTAFLFGRYRIR